MATVNLCDRCNSLMLSRAGVVMNLYSAREQTRDIELCPECHKELDAWLSEAPAREKTVYRDPYVKELPASE